MKREEWETVRLGDVCDVNMGQSPDSKSYNSSGDGLPFYQGNADFGMISPSATSWCSEPKKIAHKDDILISVRAPIGALNIANETCCIGRGLASLTVNPNLCSQKYMWHCLKSKVLEFNRKGTGSTFKAINKAGLTDTEIPLPPLDIQRRIADTLDKVTELIDLRKKQLEKLDELIKARFVEMFGDPVLNPYNWDVVTIGDIVTDVKYGTSKPAVDGGKYPYLRMNNLTYDGHLDLSDMKYIDIPDNEIEKCIVRKGDVLFNRTNSIELVGKTCVFDLDDEMVIAGYIIRVRLNEKLLPIVLSSYMNSTVLKEQLRNMAKGAVNQANINAQELQSIKIYLPPLELQEQFATFVEQTDKSKVTIQQSLDALETLKKSLMQEYFG